MNYRSCIDELDKLGAVTEEQARGALDRLDTLERTKPTAGQVGRYGALGAAAGVATQGISDAIKGKKLFEPAVAGQRFGRGRVAAAAGITGALAGGALPLARNVLDRHAEHGKLRTFMNDYDRDKAASVSNGQGDETVKEALGLTSVIPGTEGIHLPGLSRIFGGVEKATQNSKPLAAGTQLVKSRADVLAARRASFKPAPAATKLSFDTAAASKVLQAAKGKIVRKGMTTGIGYGYVPPINAVDSVAKAWSQHSGQPLAQLRPAFRGATAAARAQLPVAGLEGKMLAPERGDAMRFFRQVAGGPEEHAVLNNVKTPAQRKMLDAVVKGHELSESRGPAGFGAAQFGHRSMDVIMQEHNRLATLPKGMEPVKRTMQSLRDGKETPVLRNYGVEFGEGSRLSRHARKHINGMIEHEAMNGLQKQEAGMQAAHDFAKSGFAVSEYSGPLSYGPFQQASKLPPRTRPSLAAPVVKQAFSPASALAASSKRGTGMAASMGGSTTVHALTAPKPPLASPGSATGVPSGGRGLAGATGGAV